MRYPRIEHAESSRFPDPALPRMPFADVLVPNNIHRRDALAGERGSCGSDSGIVLCVPGREERHLARLGQASEVLDFPKRVGRGFFKQGVQAALNAFARDLVARRWRRGDRHGIEPIHLVE